LANPRASVVQGDGDFDGSDDDGDRDDERPHNDGYDSGILSSDDEQ